MEGTGKCDHGGTPGRGARDLDGVFCRFGPGGKEYGLGFATKGCKRVQPLGEFDIGFVGRDLKRGMGIEAKLFFNSSQDFWMTMAGIEYRNAAREIDISPALDVPQLRVIGLCGKDRIGGRHATGHGPLAAGEKFSIDRHDPVPLW